MGRAAAGWPLRRGPGARDQRYSSDMPSVHTVLVSSRRTMRLASTAGAQYGQSRVPQSARTFVGQRWRTVHLLAGGEMAPAVCDRSFVVQVEPRSGTAGRQGLGACRSIPRSSRERHVWRSGPASQSARVFWSCVPQPASDGSDARWWAQMAAASQPGACPSHGTWYISLIDLPCALDVRHYT